MKPNILLKFYNALIKDMVNVKRVLNSFNFIGLVNSKVNLIIKCNVGGTQCFLLSENITM